MTGAIEDPATFFATKAANYDRFRWDYAPAAITAVSDKSALDDDSLMADIGSGTGILTRHFLNKVRIVYAVEPNQAMRSVAEERHYDSPAFRSVSNRAESTALTANSLDLIVVGQALHWFDSNQAPVEFSRILKPDGWLAVFWNTVAEGDLSQAFNGLFSRFGGGEKRPTMGDLLSPYFRDADYQQLSFSIDYRSNWQQFFGGAGTASWAPAVNEPEYQKFKAGARAVFEQYNSGGELTIEVISNVAIGRPIAKGSG
jgi:ubiquinone/menaquinone biosynthesis C-methylase UbiE